MNFDLSTLVRIDLVKYVEQNPLYGLDGEVGSKPTKKVFGRETIEKNFIEILPCLMEKL